MRVIMRFTLDRLRRFMVLGGRGEGAEMTEQSGEITVTLVIHIQRGLAAHQPLRSCSLDSSSSRVLLSILFAFLSLSRHFHRAPSPIITLYTGFHFLQGTLITGIIKRKERSRPESRESGQWTLQWAP